MNSSNEIDDGAAASSSKIWGLREGRKLCEEKEKGEGKRRKKKQRES